MRLLIGGPKPVVRIGGRELPAYPAGKENRWKVLFGLSALAPAGPQEIVIESSGVPPRSQTLEVQAGAFPSESITFTPDKQKLFASSASESHRLHQLLSAETPEQYWNSRFSPPVRGKILTGFGVRRNYEDYHRGVDLESPEGTPVRAAAAGRVVLAETMALHGNTVLIDHGEGVMSIYLHMSKLLVKPGEEVKKRQPVGLVGSTGLATAPHLHWGVYVHGVPVDPLEWTKKRF